MTNTTTRKPFTAITWATLAEDHAYLSQDYVPSSGAFLGWEAEYDLAVELNDLHENLTIEQARVLVGGTTGSYPVIITWDTYLPGLGKTETVTTAANIEYLSTQQVRIVYCGFGHWINIDQITAVSTFDSVVSYS